MFGFTALDWEWLLESVVASLIKIIQEESAILKCLLWLFTKKKKEKSIKPRKKTPQQIPEKNARKDWI